MAPLTLEQLIKYESSQGRRVDPSMDLTKLRKTISNRLSAQRCRNKKAHYMQEMEKKVTDLQATISFLRPEIENYKHKKNVLTMQNASLQEQLDSITHISNLLKEEIDGMQREVQKLKELHDTQKYQKFQLQEYEQEKENRQPILGMTMNQQDIWGIEPYLNMELWGNSIFNNP
nr:basic leucine zipper 19 [Ipomoea trifida]